MMIPMSGFVESFNISVAASLIMYEARSWRLRNLGRHGDLSEEEREVLLAVLMLRHKVGLLRVGLVTEVMSGSWVAPPS